MSTQPEMGSESRAEVDARPPRPEEPSRLAAGVSGSTDLDLIACDGCGRRFAAWDGRAMIAAIKGPCPSCGGRFQLVAKPSPPTA